MMERKKNPWPPGRFLNNLQTKVTLLFLLVSIAPVGISGAFFIGTVRKQVLRMVSNQLENVASDKVSLLERWLMERKADLEVISSSSILRSMDPEAIAAYLSLVQKHYKVYQGFIVADPAGAAIFDDAGRGGNYRDEPWFQETMTGHVYQSGVSFATGSNESVFSIALPVSGEPGEIKGAFRATIGTRAILSIILRVSLGETGESYLVDKSGTFLAHQDPKRILRENIALSGSFQNIFGGSKRRSFYTDYRGIEVMGTSLHVPGTEWYLVVEQDRDEALAGLYRLRRYIYAAIICSLAGSFFIASLLASYIAGPIRRLASSARSLERGEFETAEIATTRRDEIGSLYEAFGKMAERLKARQKSLEQEVDNIEAELEKTDQKLKITGEAAVRSQRLAALGRLAAGVTHEIRTPLASLKLFLQSVKEEIETSPEAAEDYQIALQQVARIEATINRFLDFAKPQEPIWGAVNVPQLISQALLVIQPRAHQQETLLQTRIAPDLPEIRGDQKQLSEALLNLMVNALDATAKGDAVIVSAGAVSRPLNGRIQERIRIDISDTGSGIAPNAIPKLFDPFYTTKSSGTGLGLSIVHSTIMSHGGEITVESKEGQGSAFSLFLPAPNRPGEKSDE